MLRRPRHWLSAALMLPLMFLLPTWGDAPHAPPLGACYMGYGKTLEAAQSRQLSLNAHVTRFLYQPGGLEIAYEGSQKDGEDVTSFIRLAGVRRGEATTLVSTPGYAGTDGNQADQSTPPYRLAGWSGDGRYLLVEQEHFIAITNTDTGYFAKDFVCVDVGADPIHLSPITLPDPQLTNTNITLRDARYWWSPDRTRLLFAMQAHTKQDEGQALLDIFCTVYEPKTGKLQDIVLGEKQVVRGWLDREHLLLDDSKFLSEFTPSSKVHYASYDIHSGTQSVIATPAKMPPLHDDLNLDDTSGGSLSPTTAFLRLEDEPRHLLDPQKVGAVNAHALWVRRTQGPKLQSAAPVGLTPGTDNPQAVWSPTGTQIAFIAHGDLFVTDLTMRDSTLTEKYKAGETLTCEEERDLAANNLKQVGLALLQYNQDYDEKFPPSDNWQERIGPYLGPDTLLAVAGHPAVYHTPAKLSLADMDDPANTVLGTIDLPCAIVTLYSDGHVKTVPKPE